MCFVPAVGAQPGVCINVDESRLEVCSQEAAYKDVVGTEREEELR